MKYFYTLKLSYPQIDVKKKIKQNKRCYNSMKILI